MATNDDLPPNVRWLAMVLRDREVTPAAKTVAAVMATRYMDYRTLRRCRPANDTLVVACDLNGKTVRAAKAQLVALGFLVLVHKGGMHHGKRVASTYRGTFPKGRPAPREPERPRSSKPRGPVVPE